MDSQALLEQVYQESFNDEFTKLAESVYNDPQFRKDLRKINTSGGANFYIPAGILGGSLLGTSLGSKLTKGSLSIPTTLFAMTGGALTGAMGGSAIGSVLSNLVRDRAVKKLPKDSKFRKTWETNREGGPAAKQEAADFSKAFNEH